MDRSRSISEEELGRHNKVEDCWVVIDGAVYDVTDWIPRHPGGGALGSMAGEDVSSFFHSAHMRDVSRHLERYRVGTMAVKPSPLRFDDPFFVALKSRVRSHLREAGVNYRVARRTRRNFALSLAALVSCWILTYVASWWIFAIPMGLVSCAMVGALAHEHCHGLLDVRVRRERDARSVIWSVIWAVVFPFMPEKHFQYEHLRHHMAPLDEHLDYEVFALRRFLRLAPTVQRRWYMRFQHRYAPLVYSFYITAQVLGGFVGTYFDRRCLSRDRAYRIQVWGMPLVTLAVHVVIPISLVGWRWWALSFFLHNIVWQVSTYFVAAVVHLIDARELDSDSWAQQVCHKTANVMCGNPFYDWLSGGFNYQIEHHLLPSIAREYLPEIAPIVRVTCEEFGYPYRSYDSFTAFRADHYSYLVALGAASEATP